MFQVYDIISSISMPLLKVVVLDANKENHITGVVVCVPPNSPYNIGDKSMTWIGENFILEKAHSKTEETQLLDHFAGLMLPVYAERWPLSSEETIARSAYGTARGMLKVRKDFINLL